jgi:hypothetical protein
VKPWGVEGWRFVGEDIWGGEYEEWSGREERRGKREEVGMSRRGRAVRSESSRERESKV